MKLSILLVLIFTTSCSSKQTPICNERLGVVEYGTSRIKLLIADINRCQHQLNTIIHKQEWEVETDRNILRENDGSLFLNRVVIDRTLEVSAEARSALSKFNVKAVSGIATGTYRTITTAPLILGNYGRALGGQVRVLSKLDEVSMSLRSVMAKEKPKGKFIVWDFGGNSMQFSVVVDKVSSSIVGLPGSTPIKEEVSSFLGKKNSPNPILASKLPMVEKHLIQKYFTALNSLSSIKEVQIYGVGGVHVKSIEGNLHNLLGVSLVENTYTKDQVDELVKKLVELKDIDIGGLFASAQATNALTIYAIMNYVGWDKVILSEQTLALGYMITDFAGKLPPVK